MTRDAPRCKDDGHADDPSMKKTLPRDRTQQSWRLEIASGSEVDVNSSHLNQKLWLHEKTLPRDGTQQSWRLEIASGSEVDVNSSHLNQCIN